MTKIVGIASRITGDVEAVQLHIEIDGSMAVSGVGTYHAIDEKILRETLETELGWIVIDPTINPLVPEIEEDYSPTHILVGGETFSKSLDPQMARAQAVRWAVAVRWIEAQPKIDPADLDALARALATIDAGHPHLEMSWEDIAKELLKSGKVTVNHND